MVGKVVKRLRLHQAAPKPATPQQGLEEAAFSAEALTSKVFAKKDQTFLTSDIFAGVKIDPKSLVKKLDIDSRNTVSIIKGEDKKALLSKKDKMKLRKNRWLQKIENMKLAKQQQKAVAKRKATPVVGDMTPLMEALPELSDLVTVSKFCRQPKIQPKKRMLTNFSQMTSGQKRNILVEEVAQFHKTISDPLFKTSPLIVIGEHLSKRLKLEKEG